MTKNNLRQHLSWLLNRGPPQIPALQLSTWSDETTTATTVTSTTATFTISLDAQPNEYLPRTSAPSDHGKSVQRPAEVKVDNDGDIVIHDAEMARLQFAPSSTTKPRMLSCTKNGSSSISSTPIARRVLENDGNKLDTLTRSSVKGTVPESISPRQNTRKTPSHRPLLPLLSSDFKSPFDEVESIDLTGDVEQQPTSSGTIETFGEPLRLWREDYASLVEPTTKRGKKRKSNEYQSDLVSPRKDSPRIAVSGTPSKARLLERSTSPISLRDSSKHPMKLERSSHPPPVRPAVSRISSTRNRKHVIANSDDDDGDEMEDPDLFNWDADEELGYPDLSKKLVDAEHDEPPSQPRSQTTQLPPKSTSIGNEELVQSTPRCSPREVQNTAQVVLADASTPSLSQMTKDPKVERFLGLSSNAVDAALDTLRQDLKANAEIVYQHAMEGESPPAEIITRTKSLRSGIDAMEKAKIERASHQTCKDRIEALKAEMIKGIVEGSSGLQAYTTELEQSRSTAKELQQIEARMADLLNNVDLRLLNSSRFNAPVASALNNLVQGTQHFPASKHPETSPEKTENNRTPAPTSQRSYAAKPTLPHLSHKIDSMVPTDDDNDNSTFEGVDTFTRNMGSPPTFHNDFDEFDLDDAEDDDFLDAATNASNLDGHGERGRQFESRPVFAETSGNINRVPPRKSVAPDPSAMMAHPWSRDVRNVMRERFHLRGFRPNQLEAINATLSGKDAFVLMPTGGGKSLCYQLPSIVSSGATKGVTIVVSPLLSLMEDQVEHLKKLKIKAHFINGDVSAEHKRWVSSTLRNFSAEQHIELLYVTPEMVNKNLNLREILQALHRNRKFARLVIDEAHCVSQWGHDFRPDYKELGAFRLEFPGVPVMALTATATETVKLDVIHNLGMSACDVFTQSFNRPNLTYDVRPKKGSAAAIVDQIAGLITTSYHRQAGIVYCLSRKDCEKVAELLSTDHGIKAAHYHAGMNPEERSAIQKGWQSGKHHVIVATIAFGMGIDKPDVRFVIHHTIPKSLEGYYQETGRAGRDGKRSGCYLFYTYKDTAQQRRFIDTSEGSWQQKNRQREMLRNVVQFCENQSDCRRVQILAYFNESFKTEDCNQTCDNCQSEAVFEARDFTLYAQKALELVNRFKDRKEDVTLLQCIDIFAGSLKRMKPGFKNLPQYGAGSDLELEDVERLFYKLISEQVLYEKSKLRAGFTHTYIRLSKGKKAGDILDGQCSVELKIRVDRQSKKLLRRGNTTGVAAAMDDHPQSTNVPSPVAASRRRARQQKHKGPSNGDNDEDGDSDGFERIRVAGNLSRRRGQALGPPITHDDRLKEIDEIHQLVIDDFVSNAKSECQKIMMQKHLRNQPFSDAILREMVIHFCKDSKELSKIPDIDSDKVERYGEQFLKLVRNSKRLYQEMKKNNEVVPDPNHATVINITSSDEDEYGSDDEIFDVVPISARGNQGSTSRYFDASASSNRSLTSRPTRPHVSTQLTDPDNIRSSAINRAASPSAASTGSRGRQRSGSRRTSGGGRRKAAGAGTGRKVFSSGSQRPKKAIRGRGGASAGGTGRSASSSKRGASSKASLSRIEMMPT